MIIFKNSAPSLLHSPSAPTWSILHTNLFYTSPPPPPPPFPPSRVFTFRRFLRCVVGCVYLVSLYILVRILFIPPIYLVCQFVVFSFVFSFPIYHFCLCFVSDQPTPASTYIYLFSYVIAFKLCFFFFSTLSSSSILISTSFIYNLQKGIISLYIQ